MRFVKKTRSLVSDVFKRCKEVLAKPNERARFLHGIAYNLLVSRMGISFEYSRVVYSQCRTFFEIVKGAFVLLLTWCPFQE